MGRRNAIVLTFDSLNRHFLPPYGCADVAAPNFQRLARQAAAFDRAYVGSLPCMPARREFHTGRYELLHRFWGQLEPFDDSMPELLKEAGIHTHLATDHYHYFEDLGATYHGRYTTWEFFRGQEGDPFLGLADGVAPPPNRNGKGPMQDWVNRTALRSEEDWPITQTVNGGLAFLERNHASDTSWMLHVECFDPHEPFVTPRHYLDLYDEDPGEPLFDWMPYGPTEAYSESEIRQLRLRYRATVSMCDHALGRVLDAMDRHQLWESTLLIVHTDHGIMLGEHGCFGKNWQPWYEELSHIPLFIHDPQHPEADGARRSALVQTVDLAPTLLRYFDQPLPANMEGADLAPVLADDAAVRQDALFGIFGGDVNLTDGRHVYMRAPVPDADGNAWAWEYTLIGQHLRISSDFAASLELADPLPFTKGMPVMRFRRPSGRTFTETPHRLYDLETDPGQTRPVEDPALESEMRGRLSAALNRHQAPSEQWIRLGL